jgi:hypothetical protein
MRALLQAQEIIFEVQRKMNNEKIARGKRNFSTHKTHFIFIFFPSLWTSPFKASNFFISYSF